MHCCVLIFLAFLVEPQKWWKPVGEEQNCRPRTENRLLLSCLPAVISRNQEGPGEMGKAVLIPRDEQDKMKELFKINQFNLMASDLIALNRSLPDVRLEG